jgi:glycine betaine/proline transport system permease protein
MDLLKSIYARRLLSPIEAFSHVGLKRTLLTLVVLLVIGDLMIEYVKGPTRDFFFPRLYTFVFVGLGGWIIWISLKPLGLLKWRLLVGGVIVAVLVLSIKIAPTEFPHLAPGQEYVNVETSRVTLVKPVSLHVLGLEIRPYSLGKRIDAVVEWMVEQWRGFFRTMTTNLLSALTPLERLLMRMPWWIMIGVVGLLAWKVSGYKVALLSIVSLVMIGLFGLWGQTMRTLAVVGTATLMSVGISIPLGIAMSKNDKLEGALKPLLDAMQTMPSFVYLIPAIYFLGLGKVPAVMATMIYAMPPAMRMTNLGIRLVSQDLVEAARSFGTTPLQMLIKIQLPMARPTIMAGVNQTIMMALAMVVVASMVGARGLGYDILSGIQNLEFGTGLMAGFAIVILAVVIDRIAQGFARDPRNKSGS